MKKEQKTEIKVGLTVLIAIILFIFVYGWAKNFSLSSEENYLTIKFPTVAGLEIGDMVSVNGVRKGLVESIETDASGALVKVKFHSQCKLNDDAKFSIMMLDLMGGKKIEINSGRSTKPLDFSIRHEGFFAGDVATAMATLNSVENDLVKVIGELRTSLEGANSLLGDQNFANNISESVQNLNHLTKNINELVTSNKEVLNSFLKNADELTERTNSVLDENKEQIGLILTNLDSTLKSSNKLIGKISIIANEVKSSENNLGKILYDENLLDDLKISLKQIKEMTSLINQQLKSGGLEVKADVDLF